MPSPSIALEGDPFPPVPDQVYRQARIEAAREILRREDLALSAQVLQEF